MTPITRTEGAADGLREAVGLAIEAVPFHPCTTQRERRADAAIAAVREWDQKHDYSTRAAVLVGYEAGLRDAAHQPQPVPVVATGALPSDRVADLEDAKLRDRETFARGLSEGLRAAEPVVKALAERLSDMPLPPAPGAPGAPAARPTR